MSDLTITYFQIITHDVKFSVDYTPNWKRGNPNNYIDNVVFPKVLTNKKYSYGVVVDGASLGVQAGYEVSSDGSQKVNFLEYNSGYGISDKKKIQVYAVDPDTGNQFKVAQWN